MLLKRQDVEQLNDCISVTYNTKIGKIKIAYHGKEIVHIYIFDYIKDNAYDVVDKIDELTFNEFIIDVERENKGHIITDEVIYQLYEYFCKSRKKFSFRYKLIGTEFQKRVWKELIKVEYGSLCSYKDVARKIGHSNSCRAVANAIGKNPLLILVPCHRVIRGDGSLGGFSAGVDLKEGLITLERKNSF
ncbi:MAG: methylated-DNA--[protein]-cysteine S-methyltransferase [Gallibacter sp.]|nr:methylated-DNA--[protein]-cysteine S-methyltransferase [Gallibacter sp.]